VGAKPQYKESRLGTHPLPRAVLSLSNVGACEVMRGLVNGFRVVIRDNEHPMGSAEQYFGNMFAVVIEKSSVDFIDVSSTLLV